MSYNYWKEETLLKDQLDTVRSTANYKFQSVTQGSVWKYQKPLLLEETEWPSSLPKKHTDKLQYRGPAPREAHPHTRRLSPLEAHSPMIKPLPMADAPSPREHRPPESASLANKQHQWPTGGELHCSHHRLPQGTLYGNHSNSCSQTTFAKYWASPCPYLCSVRQ